MSQPFAKEVAAARAAQASWCRLTIVERLRPVRSLRNLIAHRADALIQAVESDIGRSHVEVVATELLPAAAALRFLEKKAQRVLAPRRVRWRPMWLMGCRDEVVRRAWGVVGVIGTWNYPVFLNVGPIAQAFVAGNAVLWKPSENAPRTADLLHALFLEAGFPAELFQKLAATREAGPQLAEAEIDRMVFTGSETVGRKLAVKLGERLIPSTLELSGCDAMFVLSDANLELAAKAAWFGVTLNRGQTCIAVRRIFIQRTQCEAFEKALRKLLPNTGPLELVTTGQVEQAERLIEDAVKRGARAWIALPPRPPLLSALTPQPPLLSALTPQPPLPGGEGEKSDSPSPPGRGSWGVRADSRGGRGGRAVTPTLLFDTPPDSAICREACFAPIAAVIPFDSIDEAVSLAKQCSFGLGASIFTADVEAARSLSASIPAGSVTINDVLAPTAHPATPFGGRGASGWGVTQGAEGLLEMTIPQVVTVRKGTFRPHFDEAVKPDPATGIMLRGLLRFTHARGLREKFRGLREMIRGARNRGNSRESGS